MGNHTGANAAMPPWTMWVARAEVLANGLLDAGMRIERGVSGTSVHFDGVGDTVVAFRWALKASLGGVGAPCVFDFLAQRARHRHAHSLARRRVLSPTGDRRMWQVVASSYLSADAAFQVPFGVAGGAFPRFSPWAFRPSEARETSARCCYSLGHHICSHVKTTREKCVSVCVCVHARVLRSRGAFCKAC